MRDRVAAHGKYRLVVWWQHWKKGSSENRKGIWKRI